MSARSLPAGWTRSLVDWHRAQEPARFEADMAEMREMAVRVYAVLKTGTDEQRALVAARVFGAL